MKRLCGVLVLVITLLMSGYAYAETPHRLRGTWDGVFDGYRVRIIIDETMGHFLLDPEFPEIAFPIVIRAEIGKYSFEMYLLDLENPTTFSAQLHGNDTLVLEDGSVLRRIESTLPATIIPTATPAPVESNVQFIEAVQDFLSDPWPLDAFPCDPSQPYLGRWAYYSDGNPAFLELYDNGIAILWEVYPDGSSEYFRGNWTIENDIVRTSAFSSEDAKLSKDLRSEFDNASFYPSGHVLMGSSWLYRVYTPSEKLEHTFSYIESADGTLAITGWFGSGNQVIVPEHIGGKKVTAIAPLAFCDITAHEVILPDTLRTIGRNAFFWCESLETLMIPEGVTEISPDALEGLYALKTLSLPSTLDIAIDSSFLTECTASFEVQVINGSKAHKWALTHRDQFSTLTEHFRTENPIWHTESLPDGTLTITGYIGSSSHLEVPERIDGRSVTELADYAFLGASFETISLPETIRSIGVAAFSNCSNLREFDVPNGVTALSKRLFSGCDALERVYVPASVTSPPSSNCFPKNDKLVIEGVKGSAIAKWVESEAVDSFEWWNGSFTKAESADGVMKEGMFEFRAADGYDGYVITAVHNDYFNRDPTGLDNGFRCEIPLPWSLGRDYDASKSVYVLGDGLFANVRNLISVTFPNRLAVIGASAFENCSMLTNLELNSELQQIGNRSFAGCSGLTELTIPDKVHSIGAEAFAACSHLGTVYLSSSVSYIGKNAFPAHTQLILVEENAYVRQWAFENNIVCNSIGELDLGINLKKHWQTEMDYDSGKTLFLTFEEDGTFILRSQDGINFRYTTLQEGNYRFEGMTIVLEYDDRADKIKLLTSEPDQLFYYNRRFH